MIEKHIPKTETRYDDLAGAASLNFHDHTNLDQFAVEIAGVDLSKYKPISVRFFIIDKETIVTIYGLDKENYQEKYTKTGKLPVKKYKVETSFEKLLHHIKQIDFTMVSGEHDVEDFEVIN